MRESLAERRLRQYKAREESILAFREAEVQQAREATGNAALRYENLPLRKNVRRTRWVV